MKILLEMEIEGLPPTVNSMYRSMKGGTRYKTAACREYQEHVSRQMRGQWHEPSPYTGRAGLAITYRVKDKRRWDIDNRVKALQDCLISAGVLKDDSQIDSLQVTRLHSDISSTKLILSEYETKTT